MKPIDRKGRDMTARQRRRLSTRNPGATATLPPVLHCDFCGSKNVVTCFSTEARTMVMSTPNKVTRLIDNGHWGACEGCARLVRLRKIEELAQYSYDNQNDDIKAMMPPEFVALVQRGLFWPGWHGLEHPLSDHPSERKETVH